MLPQFQALEVSADAAGKVKLAVVDTGFEPPAGFQHARGERPEPVSSGPSPAQAEPGSNPQSANAQTQTVWLFRAVCHIHDRQFPRHLKEAVPLPL